LVDSGTELNRPLALGTRRQVSKFSLLPAPAALASPRLCSPNMEHGWQQNGCWDHRSPVGSVVSAVSAGGAVRGNEARADPDQQLPVLHTAYGVETITYRPPPELIRLLTVLSRIDDKNKIIVHSSLRRRRSPWRLSCHLQLLPAAQVVE
jgi:hypothetical protein